MPYTIDTEKCEGVADCEPVCPVECISAAPEDFRNKNGFHVYWIDFETCIDCGACLSACPVEGAVLDTQEEDKQTCPRE